MSPTTTFTPEQEALILRLIADECPTGEIAETVGVSRSVLTKYFPSAKGTRAQIKDWLSVGAFVRETEAKYCNPRTGLPELGRGRAYREEQRRRAAADRSRARAVAKRGAAT